MSLPLLTIASGNYIAHVRALAASYLRYHPGAPVFLCLVDRPGPGFDPAREPFSVFLAEDLAIPRWPHVAFRYDIMELNTAVKPFALRHLVRTHGFDRVVYLDPDIIVYHTLAPLETMLRPDSIVLTPHLLAPVPSEEPGVEHRMLQYGAFNLGFLAVAWGADVERFMGWWQTRLLRYCVRDKERGLFVDQKWMDLASSFLPGTHIWRDPACNVAWWNLTERPLSERDGQFLVRGQPLRFAHFSGFSVENAGWVTSRDRRLDLAKLPTAAHRLLEDYRHRLLALGYQAARRHLYAYGRFHDGTPISDAARHSYRELDPAGQRWPDPFRTGPGTFHERWSMPRTRTRRLARSILGPAGYRSLADAVRRVRRSAPRTA